MVSYNVPSTDDRLSLLETVVDNAPTGLLLIDGQTILLANPEAAKILETDAGVSGQTLTIDGPDGPLADRLAEAGRSGLGMFRYVLPANDSKPERTLRIQVVPLDEARLLAHIDDITALRLSESKRDETIRHIFHELKTPLGVLSLGLSNLLAYYERLPQEDRLAHLEDLSEQVREMNDVMTELFKQLRNTSG
jgi:nitrogen fixation/metabolism regulation signal transduction histidine kinase